MLQVNMDRNGNELVVFLEGRLDTLSADDFEEQLEDALDGVERLIIDLEKLDYISSAGLRIFSEAMQVMSEQGEMLVRNVGKTVMGVFELTGFSKALTIV